jgi:hypothetical protein
VTATFDQSSYATGEEMTITVTVRNTGAERIGVTTNILEKADAVTVTSANTLEKIRLLPGNSVTRELTGAVGDANLSTAKLYLQFLSGTQYREVSFAVPVTPRYGRVSGIVYHDENGNGKLDNGEGLAGATLTWTNQLNESTSPTVTTDSAGRFAADVPTGPYWVSGKADGLQIGSRAVTVPESGVDDLLFRAAPRPDLDVDLEFTKDTYAPDEAPTVRVRLTNKGDVQLNGVVATCHHADFLPNLTGKGGGWSDLAADGVTIAPNRTRVLEVTEPMPANASAHGYVAVDCTFSYPGVWENMNHDRDEASVPGQFAEVTGVITSSPGVDLSGFRIVLASADGACPITAQGKSSADGQVKLGRVPVGRYHAYAVPPTMRWWFKSGNNRAYDVSITQQNVIYFMAFPHPQEQDLKLPPDCPGSGGPSGNPPAPQGSAGDGLANTGASLVLPGIAGLLALLAGLGTVLLTRKRDPSEKDTSQLG